MSLKKKNSFLQMNGSERDQVVKELDHEIDFEETRPLSPKGKALWKRARGSVGSPRAGRKTKAVVIAVDQSLLDRSDAYARQQGISRSELIAKGLQAVLPH